MFDDIQKSMVNKKKNILYTWISTVTFKLQIRLNSLLEEISMVKYNALYVHHNCNVRSNIYWLLL